MQMAILISQFQVVEDATEEVVKSTKYTFKKDTTITEMNAVVFNPGSGAILNVKDNIVLSAPAYGSSVSFKIDDETSIKDVDYYAISGNTYTVPEIAGKTLYMYAKAVAGSAESEPASATYYIRPAAAEKAVVEGDTLTVTKPAGVVTGFIYKVDGDWQTEVPFTDAATEEVKVPVGSVVSDVYTYVEAAGAVDTTAAAKAGYVYSAEAVVVKVIPAIVNVYINGKLVDLTKENVLVVGDTISVETTGDTVYGYFSADGDPAKNSSEKAVKITAATDGKYVFDATTKDSQNPQESFVDKANKDSNKGSGKTFAINTTSGEGSNLVVGNTVYVKLNVIDKPVVSRVAIKDRDPADLTGVTPYAVKSEDTIIIAIKNADGVTAKIDGKEVNAVEGSTDIYSVKLGAEAVEELVLTPYIVIGEGKDAETINGDVVEIALDYVTAPKLTSVTIDGVPYYASTTETVAITEDSEISAQTADGEKVWMVVGATTPQTVRDAGNIFELKEGKFTTSGNGNTVVEAYNEFSTKKINVQAVNASEDGKVVLYSDAIAIPVTLVELPKVENAQAVYAPDATVTISGTAGATYEYEASIEEGYENFTVNKNFTFTEKATDVNLHTLANSTGFEGNYTIVLKLKSINGVAYEGENKLEFAVYTTAVTINGVPATSYEAALANGLTLTKEHTLEDDIVVPENKTLSLNGNVLELSTYDVVVKKGATIEAANAEHIQAKNGGKLVLEDGATLKVGGVILLGPNNFSGGNIEITSLEGGAGITINGNVTIKGAVGTLNYDVITVNSGSTLTIAEGGSVTINTNGTFTNNGTVNGSVIEIGGTVNGSGTTNP